jgi:hypothetical protein
VGPTIVLSWTYNANSPKLVRAYSMPLSRGQIAALLTDPAQAAARDAIAASVGPVGSGTRGAPPAAAPQPCLALHLAGVTCREAVEAAFSDAAVGVDRSGVYVATGSVGEAAAYLFFDDWVRAHAAAERDGAGQV